MTTLLDGRTALVVGVSNEHSIGWGIAKALHEHGALVGVTRRGGSGKLSRLRALAETIESPFVAACDVTDDAQIRGLFERWRTEIGPLDVLVHSLAQALPADLAARFSDTSRDGFAFALDTSAYSLVGLVREAQQVLRRGSSVIALSYYGARKVASGYKVMGVAKAALEACVRTLAAELGPSGVRVNAISAGPVRTVSARGVSGFATMHKTFPDLAPMRSALTGRDVGRAAVWLASDLARAVTGEVIFVDGGFSILAPATAT